MYIIRNLLKLIFVYFPILFVLIGAYFFAQKNYEIISDNLEDFTCAVLSQYLNADIKAEKIIIQGTKIVIHNAVIKDQNNQNLITAKKIFIKLTPFSKNQICKSIYIDSANATITENNNKWNFDFILNQFDIQQFITSKYAGPVVLIVNSHININSNTYKYKDTLTNISSRLDFSNKNYAHYSVNLESEYTKNITAYARFNYNTNQTTLKIKGNQFDLALLNNYKNFIKNEKFASLKACNITGKSVFEINANIINSKLNNFSFVSSTENLSVNSPYGHLEKTKLNIKGNKNILSYNIKGEFNKANIYSKGQVSLKKTHNLQGIFTAENLNITNFSTLLPKEYKSLKGQVNASATIKGNIKDPHISGKIKAKDIKYNTYYVKNLKSKFELNKGQCIYELDSILKNGKVYSYGKINNINIFNPDIKNISTDSLICVRNLNIQDYIPYSANLSGDFSVKGKLTNPNITSNIELSKGIFKFNKTYYKDLNANLSLDYNNNKIHIKSGLVQNLLNNNIIVSGNIDKALNCDISLSINNVDISKFAKNFDLDIKGIVSLKSHIIKGEKIYSENLLNLEDFSYNNYKLNFTQINFNINSDKIKINNCTILDFPAALSFMGEISPIKKDTDLFNFNSNNTGYTFCFKLDENNLTAQKLCEKLNLKTKDLKGITKGDLSVQGEFINGKINNLSGGGNLYINNIEYQDFNFSSLETKIDLKDTIINFYDIKGNANSYSILKENIFGSIEGKASYDINEGYFKGDLNVKNINLNDYRKYYKDYINVFGLINLNINFNGQYQKINAEITGDISQLNINSKSYDKIPINLTLKESDIVNGDFVCKRNNQLLTGKIENLSLQKQEIGKLSIDAKHLEVNDLREIFYLSPIATKPEITKILKKIPIITGGEIEGRLNISGPIKAINGSCEIDGSNINADFDKINRLTAKLSAKKGIIDLDNLELEGTEFLMTCDAHPLFDRQNAKINMTLINLPLSRFGKYIKINNIKGTLSAESLIEGNLSHPNITTSVSIDNPIINNIEMKELQVAKIDVDDKYISFPQGINLFLTDDNSVKLEGKIPLSVIYNQNSNETFNLKLSAPKQDLDIIETLNPHIIKDSTKGTFYASADLEGTLEKADLKGEISIDNGELTTIGNIKLNNINSKIKLSNDEEGNVIFNIEKMTFADDKLKDESFKVTEGYVKIANSSIDTDTIDLVNVFNEGETKINVLFDNYYLKSNDFSQFQDKTTATVNGVVKIEGNLIEPKIYTENPIILSDLVSSFKTATNTNEALVNLTNKNFDNHFYYNDTTEFDEIKIRRDINKQLKINPKFDINLTTQKADIRPPATILKANGNLSVTGDLNNPIINGEGIVTEGRINFAIARARIVKGSKINMNIKDNNLSGNINANAFSYVHFNDKTGQDQRYKININITGDLIDPTIELDSDPTGLTTNEIITAFTGFSANHISAEDTLAKIGSNAILSPIEDFFIEYLGFDSIGFEYKQNNYALINIERSFNNKLYGSFNSNLYRKNNKNNNMSDKNNLDSPIWELKLGYRLNTRFKFDIGTNNKKEHSFNFTYGFNF